MVYFLTILLFFLLNFLLFSTGILLKRKPLQGSCGGLNKVITEKGVEYFCKTCGKPSNEIKDNDVCS